MSTSQSCEEAQDLAQVHLTAACNELNQKVEATPPYQRLIRKGLQKVEGAYDDLVSEHCDYVSALGQDVEDGVHQEFHETKMNESLDRARETMFEMDRAREIAEVKKDTLQLARKIQDTVELLLPATEMRMSATTYKHMTKKVDMLGAMLEEFYSLFVQAICMDETDIENKTVQEVQGRLQETEDELGNQQSIEVRSN